MAKELVPLSVQVVLRQIDNVVEKGRTQSGIYLPFSDPNAHVQATVVRLGPQVASKYPDLKEGQTVLLLRRQADPVVVEDTEYLLIEAGLLLGIVG